MGAAESQKYETSLSDQYPVLHISVSMLRDELRRMTGDNVVKVAREYNELI